MPRTRVRICLFADSFHRGENQIGVSVADPLPGRTGVLLVPLIMSDKIVFAVEEAASAQASLNSGSDGSRVRGIGYATNFATERLAARAYQVEANNPK